MIKARTWWWIGGTAVAFVLMYALSSILMPFMAGAVIAYLFDPIVNRLCKIKVPRTLAVVIVFLIIILLVLLFLGIFVPLLEEQLIEFIRKIPDIIAWIQATLMPWLETHLGVTTTFDVNSVKKILTSNLAQTGTLATSLWATVFSSSKTLIMWGLNILIIPVVVFYLLRDWEGIIAELRTLLPRRNARTIITLVNECDEVLGAFLRGQLLVMIGLGLLYSLGLTLMGLKMGLLIGLIAGLLSIVPYLGFIVGVGAAIVAALFQFNDILHCVLVVLVFVLSHAVEATLLTPILVGDRIGLHPVAVIFAVLAGGHLFGFFGVLLALPIAAVVMVFVRYIRERYLSSQLYQT